MGDEPVGDRDDELEETEAKNVTLKRRTWMDLENEYPHALDDTERVRMAVHDALDRDADKTE